MEHYTSELEKGGKYKLMLWPEHCVLGQSGHALSGVIQEARMFHAYARGANNEPLIKGGNPLTENYSIVQPEVLTRFDGGSIAQKNTHFLEDLLKYDYVLIAGQAASHCVKSSIEDILAFILATSPGLAQKVYVMEDCMSAVVTPAHDYTSEAERALQLFRSKGMHVVKSTTPMASWPDIQL
jgi:nicotinamidase-related amidase